MKNYIGFAAAGSVMTIIFLGLVNYLTTPRTFWFIYPSFLLLLWPATLYFVMKKSYKLYSVFCSIALLFLLIFENYKDSPNNLWFIYAVYPIVWWPILMFLGEKAKSMAVSLIGCTSAIIYYSLLNIIFSPQYPWAIYPAFLVVWWPFALYHGKRKTFVAFSFQASLLLSLFFITVNFVSSPASIWAVYPIFLVLWWPLSMYFYVYRKNSQKIEAVNK